MPEFGKYEKIPRPESIETFIKYLNSNPIVIKIERKGLQLIEIIRKGKSSLKVFMTNIYIVSLADVYEILSEVGQVDAIVTMSAWNSYTKEAKEECKKIGIGLFKFKEFMGAVYYEGQQFLDYVHPDDRKK
ncbi:hypothetical protein [Thermodesulfatator indicus]